MPNVPNNESFGLLDVFNSVNGHAPGTGTNLSSCFANAVEAYFDPTYNNISYAPANSMKRFRNYTPSGGGGVLATVVTTIASSIGFSTVTWGGNVTSEGDSPVTEHGIVYVMSLTAVVPTTSDTKLIIGSGGAGLYSTTSSNMATAGPTYYYRAYAINSAGTSYGTTYSFTLSVPTYAVPTLQSVINSTIPVSRPTTFTLAASQRVNNNSNNLGLFYNYLGGKNWWKVTISSFNSNLDGDGHNYFTLRDGTTPISSFPYTKDIASLVTADEAINCYYNDTTAAILSYIQPQTASFSVNVTDLNNLTGLSYVKQVKVEGYWIAQSSSRSITSTSVNLDCSSWSCSTVTERGWSYEVGEVTPTSSSPRWVADAGTTGYFTKGVTGLTPGTLYRVIPYIILNGVYRQSFTYQSFTTSSDGPTGYYLYNAPAVLSSLGIVASGWSVPSITAYSNLASAYGYQGLKSSTSWSTPGTNTSGFSALSNGGCAFNPSNTYGAGTFMLQWTSTVQNSTNTWHFGIQNTTSWTEYALNYLGGCVRATRSTSNPNGTVGTYVGNDGTVYPTIAINGTEWTTVDLKETKYRDGSLIPYITDGTTWASRGNSGLACCTTYGEF